MQVEKGSSIFKFWDSLDSRFSPVINLPSIFTKGCNRFHLPRPKATFVEVTFLRLKEAFPHIDCLNDGQNDIVLTRHDLAHSKPDSCEL